MCFLSNSVCNFYVHCQFLVFSKIPTHCFEKGSIGHVSSLFNAISGLLMVGSFKNVSELSFHF